MEKIKILAISYHRNGVCGEGFHVATFKWRDGKIYRHMVATIFKGSGQCAILDIDETLKDNVEFAHGNSWRGDHFEGELREAIKQYNIELDKQISEIINRHKQVKP